MVEHLPAQSPESHPQRRWVWACTAVTVLGMERQEEKFKVIVYYRISMRGQPEMRKLWVTAGVSCQPERIQSHLRNKPPGGPGRNCVDLVNRGERTHPAGGQNSSSWDPGLQKKEERILLGFLCSPLPDCRRMQTAAAASGSCCLASPP